MHTITPALIVRYLISGGLGAVTQLSLLFVLHDIFHIHYLTASCISYLAAVGVGFTMQKFWTFKAQGSTPQQAVGYVSVFVGNLILNTGLMYMFVDVFKIWYLGAQVLASGLIAIGSFFIYRHGVFKQESNVSK
jgi:putative flippase GtrA